MYQPTEYEIDMHLKLVQSKMYDPQVVLPPERFHEYLNEKYIALRKFYEAGEAEKYNWYVKLLGESYHKYICDNSPALARRFSSKLIAQDIIGIQPMSGPVGQIFTLKARYEKEDDKNDS